MAENLFKKYLFNTSWLFAEKLISIATGLFLTILISRYLGVQNYGTINYALSFVGIFGVFAGLGLNLIVVKNLIQHEKLRPQILGSTFVLQILAALPVFVVLNLASNFIASDENNAKMVILILSFMYFFTPFGIINFIFEAKVALKYSAIANLITLAINASIKVILVLINAPFMWFALSFLTDQIILAIVFWAVYKLNGGKITSWRANLKVAKSLLIKSYPLIMAGMIYVIYVRIDQLMLWAMLGASSVGIYAAGIRITETLSIIPGLISTSLFPIMINAKKQNEQKYLQVVSFLLNFMTTISFGFGIFITIFAPFLINLIFGQAYSEASEVLVINVWVILFTAMSTITYKYFIMENLQKLSFYRSLIGLILNIILNYILIPKYGVNGAAFATLGSQFGALYLFNAFDPRTRTAFIMQTKAIFMLNLIPMIKFLTNYVRKNK